MTEAPQFRVFFEDSPDNEIFNRLFPNGVPCRAYRAEDYNETIPKDFVFELDYAYCTELQIKQIFADLGEEHEHKQLDLEHHPYYIDFEEGMKVIAGNGKEWDLELLKQRWVMTNHAKKHNLKLHDIDGEVAHLLIMGLQQALFIEPTEDPLMNQHLLILAVQFIEAMCKGNTYLKMAYLSGFPCEYLESAKKQLFPE